MATPKFRRRHLVGVAVGLLILGGGAAVLALMPAGHRELESAVTKSSAPGAAHPLRVDRWGSQSCWLPMSGDCANSDLLYDSGAVPAEQYRIRWEAALRADGWVRHVEPATLYRFQFEWWSRDDVGVTFTTRADGEYGEYFEWGAGDLVVTARRVGTGSGMLPGPTP